MQDARSYFDDISAEVARFGEVRGRIIERRASISAQGYPEHARGVKVARGAVGDRTAEAAIELADAEAEDLAELGRIAAEVAQARAVCIGVGRVLGPQYRDALACRYLTGGKSWRECGGELGCAAATAQRRCSVALDYIDAVGLSGAMRGESPCGERDGP